MRVGLSRGCAGGTGTSDVATTFVDVDKAVAVGPTLAVALDAAVALEIGLASLSFTFTFTGGEGVGSFAKLCLEISLD